MTQIRLSAVAKFIQILICGAAVFLAWPAWAQHQPLLPRPQQVAYGTGALPVTHLVIRFAATPDAADQFTAEQLAGGLSRLGCCQIPIKNGWSARGAILLRRTGNGADVPADNEVAGPDSREAYSIKVDCKGAEIQAASSAGLFYGVQTLLQMAEGEGGKMVLPAAEVRDWPTLAYRGFMMDFSHGQLLRVSEIERQIDLLARFKANQYYFYSEMNIEWKGYEAVMPDGRFTQDEVRHVIAYARQRHMDVVPCMELFGHMHDLLRTEKFADVGLPRYGDEFDMRNPRAQEVADDLFDQTARLFSSPWIHVGFDEPWSLGKIGVTPGMDPFQTFVKSLQHMTDQAGRRGKRLMYWADIQCESSTLSRHPELLHHLPEGAIAVPWKYEAEKDYTRYIEPIATNHVTTMVAPAIWNWNEVFPDYHRTFANINGLVAVGKEQKTIGILNTGWTDFGQTLYRQSLPGLAFGAAAGWQGGAVDTNLFFKEYCALTCAPAAAEEVATALEQLSTIEEMFEDILGDCTQYGCWSDPLQPGRLARVERNQDACRKARLLAEQAQEHIAAAMRIAPGDPTLKSLMMAARLFDYMGMKFLYAAEWDGYFKILQKNPDTTLVTLYIGVQMNAQDHGMLTDLIDSVTGLKEQYREAWLEESTPYRLGTALAHWDAETRYWMDTWGRVKQLLHSYGKEEPFPSVNVLRAKQ
jgi:hypothetical protein